MKCFLSVILFCTIYFTAISHAFAESSIKCGRHSDANDSIIVNPVGVKKTQSGNFLLWNESKDIVIPLSAVLEVYAQQYWMNCSGQNRKDPPSTAGVILVTYKNIDLQRKQVVKIVYQMPEKTNELWVKGEISDEEGSTENDEAMARFHNTLSSIRNAVREHI